MSGAAVMSVRGPRRVRDEWLATYSITDETGSDGGWGRCLRADREFVTDWLDEALARARLNHPSLTIRTETMDMQGES